MSDLTIINDMIENAMILYHAYSEALKETNRLSIRCLFIVERAVLIIDLKKCLKGVGFIEI